MPNYVSLPCLGSWLRPLGLMLAARYTSETRAGRATHGENVQRLISNIARGQTGFRSKLLEKWPRGNLETVVVRSRLEWALTLVYTPRTIVKNGRTLLGSLCTNQVQHRNRLIIENVGNKLFEEEMKGSVYCL